MGAISSYKRRPTEFEGRIVDYRIKRNATREL